MNLKNASCFDNLHFRTTFILSLSLSLPTPTLANQLSQSAHEQWNQWNQLNLFFSSPPSSAAASHLCLKVRSQIELSHPQQHKLAKAHVIFRPLVNYFKKSEANTNGCSRGLLTECRFYFFVRYSFFRLLFSKRTFLFFSFSIFSLLVFVFVLVFVLVLLAPSFLSQKNSSFFFSISSWPHPHPHPHPLSLTPSTSFLLFIYLSSSHLSV